MGLHLRVTMATFGGKKKKGPGEKVGSVHHFRPNTQIVSISGICLFWEMGQFTQLQGNKPCMD